MTTRELREAVDVYNELLRIHQLNIELLETLELTLLSARQFCETHNIPYGNAKIDALLSKVNALLDETVWKPSDRFLQRKKSDKDLTAPVFQLPQSSQQGKE